MVIIAKELHILKKHPNLKFPYTENFLNLEVVTKLLKSTFTAEKIHTQIVLVSSPSIAMHSAAPGKHSRGALWGKLLNFYSSRATFLT